MISAEKRNRFYISQESLHDIITSIDDKELGESIYATVNDAINPKRDYYGYASGIVYIYSNSIISILKYKVPMQRDGLKAELIDKIYNSASNSLAPFQVRKRIYEEDEVD